MDSEKQIEQQIQVLKNKIDRAKETRYRAEARLEELQRQKQQYLNELEELGVAPEDLDDEIEKLSTEIEELISKAKELIPDDL